MSQNLRKHESPLHIILVVGLAVIAFGLLANLFGTQGFGFIGSLIAVLIKFLWALVIVGAVIGIFKWVQTKTPDESLKLDILDNLTGTSSCPNCSGKVKKEFKFCPHCQAVLRLTCTGCGQELRPEWAHCPGCGATKQ